MSSFSAGDQMSFIQLKKYSLQERLIKIYERLMTGPEKVTFKVQGYYKQLLRNILI